MPQWLFTTFLEDEDVYNDAQVYWVNLWSDLLRRAKTEQPWQTNWMNNPNRDGNPIFTAVCRPLRRGARIIQEDVSEAEQVYLDWWIDSFGDPDSNEEITELVIACRLSSENRIQIERLLQQWVESGKLDEEMHVD